MTMNHVNDPEDCQQEKIQEIGELFDNEYYMTAIGPPVGNRERAERGHTRIRQWVYKLESLKGGLRCTACRQEIDIQMELQRKALQEIQSIWDLP